MVHAAVLVLLMTGVSVAQTRPAQKGEVPKERANSLSLYGGMGVSMAAAPDLIDYLNAVGGSMQRLDDFATHVEFFGGVEMPLGEGLGGAVEYGYLFKSYTLPTVSAGTYTVFYNLHLPTAMVQYVVPGRGYFLKLGGGVGYHVGSVEQRNSIYGTDSSYTSRGVGLKVQAVGQTAFDEHLYAYLSADMRWEFMNRLKNSNGNTLHSLGKEASLSMFAVGLGFGLIYYF